MKKNFRVKAAILAFALALSLIAAACGGSGAAATDSAAYESAAGGHNYKSYQSASSAAYGSYDVYEDGVAEAEETAPAAPMETQQSTSSANGSDPLAGRKIIKNAYMDLETKEFDQTIREFKELVASTGGYIQNESQNGQSISYRGDYYERYANLTARIPAEKLEEVMSAVGGLCNVISQSSGMEDITDTYYDAQARLNSLTLQEERLLDILSKAEKLEDVITLEQALSEVRYEIESITASLRRMDGQVSFSTLSVNLSEVVEYQDLKTQPASFWERLAEAGSNSIRKLGDTLENILFFIVEEGPSLLIWILILFAAYLIVRKIVRAAVKRRTAGFPSPDKAEKYQGKGASYASRCPPSAPLQKAGGAEETPASAQTPNTPQPPANEASIEEADSPKAGEQDE